MTTNPKKTPGYLEDEHLSIGTKTYLKVLNAGDKPVESLPVTEARNVLADTQASVEVDLSGVEESEKTIIVDDHMILLNILRPEGKTEKLPVFIFIHGGGWVLGDYTTHKRLVRDLVVESGYACVFINYTPSPETRFPQAINEIYAATCWVAEHGNEIHVNSKQLGIVGNSVGGNMAFVTSMLAKEQKGPEIKIQILMWPVTDANFDWESYELYGQQRFLTTSLMKWMFNQYLNAEDDRLNPHLSPVQASIEELRGLPPTLIEVAENDILRDQGEALGRRLDEAGVDVTTVRFNGVIHDWGMLNGFAKQPPTHALVVFSAAMLRKYLS